ncbi:MAG: hypothetical protein GEU78_12890 [Actinobacteria bacterium]|nr:hypothetical protein [Actinomycetota bacterium]
MTEETFVCERCGRDGPRRQVKEVMYEEGKDRVKKNVCPECLDEIMNRSERVKGIAGQEKRAAVHIVGSGDGLRESFGTRD